MQEPLVSICCLCYNHEPYIRECLDGFMMQKTNFTFEVLIHDDASTDNSVQIIREYESKYPDIIKPIYQTENQYSKGVGVTRVFQFPRARGKYIALCEGDDYWIDPMKLQKQVDFLEDNEEYGLIHTNFKIFNVSTETTITNNGNFVDGQPFDEYLTGQFHIATLTTCFRKDLLEKIDTSYQKQNFKMGDYPMWIEMMRFSKFKYFPEITSIYNQSDESASRPKNQRQQILFWKNIWEIRLFFSEKYNRLNLIVKIRRHLKYYDSLLLIIEREYIKSVILLIKARLLKQQYILTYFKLLIKNTL